MNKRKFIITNGLDDAASATIAAGASVVLISMRVPFGQKLKWEGFANYVLLLEAWEAPMEWTIKRNGRPYPGLVPMTDQFGTNNQPFIFTKDVIGHGGDLLEVEVKNGHATVAYNAGALVKGGFGHYERRDRK